jgi:DNA-binding LytR/AlgR family response regulator
LLSTILIDDEEIALQQLSYLLEQYPEIDVRATFSDPVTALEKARHYQPDLIFLDIKMPEIGGLAVAEELTRILPAARIVFVTAYDEYALKAFEYNAVDYILKPVSARRIEKTVGKVLANLGSRAKPALATKLSKIRKQYGKGFNKIIAVEDAGKISLLSPADVVMFTPRGHGAVIHTKKNTYYTKQSMNYWEERLVELNFFRCHKSYLVNFDQIEKILPMFNNTYLLKIAGYPAEIPVSRSKAKELSDILGL